MARLLWTQRQDMGPPGRFEHAMAYDSARQRTVLFGGTILARPQDPESVGDTWEWNGEFWTQVEDIGPSPRSSHAMVYDAARSQTILFGGSVNPDIAGTFASGETWAWDGQAWTQLADTGPLAGSRMSMAYDSVRERVVLFGGIQDTWEWDGAEWTQTADDGPPARLDAMMTYDHLRERIVLFGGSGGGESSRLLNDTWEFNGTAWTLVGDTGPGRRADSAMVFAGTRTILFGGQSAVKASGEPGSLKDTWEWSGKHWTQRQDIGPRDRARHTMVYDSFRDKVVLFGGTPLTKDGPSVLLNDTWELPGNAIALESLTIARPFVPGGVATVTLTGPSPIGGIAVALSAGGRVEVPVSVIVGEGKTSADFPVKVSDFDPSQQNVAGIITAKLGSSQFSKAVVI